VHLYTWRSAGLADEIGFNAMLDAAGGEGDHGPPNHKGVVHSQIHPSLLPDPHFLILQVYNSSGLRATVSGPAGALGALSGDA
jgi:hypothetical protein